MLHEACGRHRVAVASLFMLVHEMSDGKSCRAGKVAPLGFYQARLGRTWHILDWTDERSLQAHQPRICCSRSALLARRVPIFFPQCNTAMISRRGNCLIIESHREESAKYGILLEEVKKHLTRTMIGSHAEIFHRRTFGMPFCGLTPVYRVWGRCNIAQGWVLYHCQHCRRLLFVPGRQRASFKDGRCLHRH